jgi:hypothetical protein
MMAIVSAMSFGRKPNKRSGFRLTGYDAHTLRKIISWHKSIFTKWHISANIDLLKLFALSEL